jgi:enolase
MSEITGVWGRQVIDSRGNPTVEVDVLLEDGTYGRCSVPSGASTGEREAIELRDEDEDVYHGKGVQTAVENVNNEIAESLVGMLAIDQKKVDETLLELDGTDDKSNLGANAILGVSLACARAAADFLQLPLFRYVGGTATGKLPVPLMNILNGGEHASNNLAIQEFMIVPHGFDSFSEALRAGVESYHTLKTILEEDGKSTSLGDEGGFAPELDNNQSALDLLVTAIQETGYEPGEQISLALDAAASEFYEDGEYDLTETGEGSRSASELIDLYETWIDQYPIVSIEDGLDQNDNDGWKELTDALGDRVQLVGDDLFVTNPAIIEEGIEQGLANSVLVKPNQIGTLTETSEAVHMAHSAGYSNILSHRSGETEDTTIADLSVALNTSQIKTGSAARSERTAKYNRLLRIEEMLDASSNYWGPDAF